jgi:type VI secretion system protein ImpL
MQEKNTEKLDEVLQKLRQRFEGAVRFLKETSLTGTENRVKLFNLPWFLLLGFHQSGKTSLLTHAQLEFVLSKKNSTEKQRFSHCEWWATKDSVFLDVNNAYTLQTRKTRRQRKCWFDFLELLHQHRRNHLFDGVVFCLDIEKLCTTNKTERSAYFHSVRGRLKDLVSYARNGFPLYFVINKCDKLAGFAEFFDNLNKEEASQLLGVTLNQLQIASPQSLADAFDLEFDRLLERLNQRLIHRLHHERNLQKRALIKDFPLQIESIKKSLAAFLQNVADIAATKQPCQLRGIYFCSTLPATEAAIDRLLQPISEAFALQTIMPTAGYQPHRPYFVQGIFNQLLTDKDLELQVVHKKQAKFLHWLEWSTVAAFGLACCAIVYSWVIDFSKNVTNVNAIEQALAQYQLLASNNTTPDLTQTLTQLEKLKQAGSDAKSTHAPWAMRLFMKHDMDIYSKADAAFLQTTQLTIQKQLQQLLTQQLQAQSLQPAELYGTLRAYLMLADPANFNKDYISNWLAREWQTQLPADSLAELTSFIQIALSQPATYQLNADLIAQARANLLKLPQAALASALIAASVTQPDTILTLPTIDKQPVFISTVNSLNIPAAYTAAEFSNVYDNIAPQVAAILTNGDWVLASHLSNNPISPTLVEEIRQFYVQQYVTLWQQILLNLQIKPFDSYNQAIAVISEFTQSNSPIFQLLYQIAANTNVYYRNAPTPISMQFNGFSQAINQELALNHDSLQQLAGYLASLQQNAGAAGAALELAKAHTLLQQQQNDAFYVLATQAQHAPPPFNNWLNELLQNSWTLILADAQKGINQIWQDSVYPEFANKIALYYPFNKDAKQDLTPQDFASFFAAGGTLDNFITMYLTPFIDTDKQPWQSKSFNGAQLPISNEVLTTLQQAVKIRQTFFANKNNNFQIDFLLKPDSLSDTVKTIDFSVDDQTAEFSQEFLVPTHFIWPGKQDNHYVAMVISGKDGNQVSDTAAGPWAIYHLLDDAAPQVSDNTVHLNYQNTPFAFDYEVSSVTTNNPFDYNLLHNFNLPAIL